MLSITVKKGKTAAQVGKVADYPDENRNKEKEPGAIEDYYSQGNDRTPSQWMGGAAQAFGLLGSVLREDHLKTLMGKDPRSDEGLVQGAGEDRRYGWDLTFSAPKSVSIAWAIGSEETRQGIEFAQMRAVEKVLKYVEENFSLARRGKGGLEREKAKLLAAAFLHGSSREQDPQIHIHLMLQNLCQREDGTFGTLEPKQIFEWKLALGALFRAELAYEMSRMGFHVEADGDSFRIVGVPKELEKEFSRRREQIEAALNAKGFEGGKASEMAALDTRKDKEVLDSSILQEDWRTRAEVHGVTRERIEPLRAGEKSITNNAGIDRKFLLDGLTEKNAVFAEKDLARAVAVEMSHRGLGMIETQVKIESLKQNPDLIRLRGKDGETYYTTREMLELEKGILTLARAGKSDGSHVLAEDSVAAAVKRFEAERGFSLSEEQKRAIDHMTRREGRIQVVQGWAGAGKTTALIPARYALEAEGFDVIGAALQGRTAEKLESETGIKSQTIHSLLMETESYQREDGPRVPPSRSLSSRSCVLVDEAAMNDTRLMARLVEATEKAGAKLVLVGDEKQVPPVQAGTPFRNLMKELGFVELTENRRQKEEWQREASVEIRAGEVKEALARYAERGTITVTSNREEALRRTVGEWAKAFDPKAPEKTILSAYRRADVEAMNRMARETLKASGGHGTLEAQIKATDRSGDFRGERSFSEGDRIVFLKNSKALDVKNGTAGTVEKIGRDGRGEWTFRVKTDEGKTVAFSPADYGQIDHGYAVTIHKSQGATVEQSFNLVGGTGLEELYVQLTRQKEGARIVMVEDQLDRAADEAGIDLAPTEKMLKYSKDLAGREGVDLPEACRTGFESCRDFLTKGANHVIEDEKIDMGLEKVKALIGDLSRSREKANVLDFTIEEKKESVKEKDRISEKDSEREVETGEMAEERRKDGKERREIIRDRGMEM